MPRNKNAVDYKFYRKWSDMKHRCNAPSCKVYAQYGGSGIKVSPEWEDYKNFYNDMWASYCEHVEANRRPNGKENTTIFRIDPNKGYSKENCRWGTYSEQNVNYRNKDQYEATNLITDEKVIFKSMTKFCEDNGFQRQRVVDCAYGRHNYCKGWVFRVLPVNERLKDTPESAKAIPVEGQIALTNRLFKIKYGSKTHK